MKEPFGPSKVLDPYEDSTFEWLGDGPGHIVKLYHLIGTEANPSQFYDVGFYEILPGESVPVHTHDVGEEFAYILHGEAILTTENDYVVGNLPEGKLVYVSEGAPHGYVNVGTMPVEIIVWASKEAGLKF